MGAGCSGGSSPGSPHKTEVQLPAAQLERKERKKRIAEYRECVFAESDFEMRQQEAWNDRGLQAVIKFCEDLPIGVVMYTEGGLMGFINYQTLELSGHTRDTIRSGNHLSKLLTTDEEIELDELCYKEVYSAHLKCRSGESLPVSLYTVALYVDPDVRRRRHKKKDDEDSIDEIFSAYPPSPVFSAREGRGVNNISGENDADDAPLVMVSFISANGKDKKTVFHMKSVSRMFESLNLTTDLLERNIPEAEDDLASTTSLSASVKTSLLSSSPQTSPADQVLAPKVPLRRLTLHQSNKREKRPSVSSHTGSSRGGSPRTSICGKDAVFAAMTQGDVIMTIDYKKGTILSASPAVQVLFGMDEMELVDKPYVQFLHTCECMGDEDTLTKLVLSDIAYPLDQRLYVVVDQSTKEPAVVHIASVLQVPNSSTAIIRFAGEKKASRQSVIRFQRFSGLPDEFGTIIDSISDATLITSSTGTIVHHNMMFGLLFDCDIDSVAGKDVSMFIPPALQRPHQEYVRRFSMASSKGLRKNMRRHRAVVGWTMKEQPVAVDMTISEISFSVDKVYYMVSVRKLMNQEMLARYHLNVSSTLAAVGLELPEPGVSPMDTSQSTCSFNSRTNTPQSTPNQLPLSGGNVPPLLPVDGVPPAKSPLKVPARPEITDPVKELRQLAEEVGAKFSDGSPSPLHSQMINSPAPYGAKKNVLPPITRDAESAI